MANAGADYDGTWDALDRALQTVKAEGVRFEVALIAMSDLLVELSIKNDPTGTMVSFVADRVFDSIRKDRELKRSERAAS